MSKSEINKNDVETRVSTAGKPIKIQIVEDIDETFFFRFVSANNKKFNHDYNTSSSCRKSLQVVIEKIQKGEFVIEEVPYPKGEQE